MNHKLLKIFIKNMLTRLDGRPQRWLADKSGVSQAKLSRMLSGQAEPDLTEIGQIAAAFQCEPCDLIEARSDQKLKNAVNSDLFKTLKRSKKTKQTALLSSTIVKSGPTFADAVLVLSALENAPTLNRALALAFLFHDVTYLRDIDPEFAEAVALLLEENEPT